MTVDLFVPCFIDQLYPETGFNVVKILEKLDIKVEYNPSQTCCGQPSYNTGYWKETRAVAQKFMKDFSGDRLIVCPSGSCAGFIRNSYPELFKDTELANEAARIAGNIIELTDLLVNKLNVTDPGSEFIAKITYHDSCAALREYGIKDEPRILLSNVKGLEIIEMKDSDACCGFGGTFSVKNEPISTAMVEQKVMNAMDTGAEYIVSTEASCLMNIEGYIKKHNLPIKTIHIADILASGLPDTH